MRLRGAVFSIASGLLLALSFPTLGLHYAVWIALVPLLSALRGVSVRAGFFLGLLSGTAFFAATIYWVTNSVHHYGGVPLLPASLITLLLCVYLALYPALFGAAVVHLRRNYPSLLFLTAPLTWTALELARAHVFTGFPWALLGYTQYPVLPLIQIAEITGVYGISFLIVMVNAGLAEFLFDRRRYPGLAAAAAVVALTAWYGIGRLAEPAAGTPITVSVIQGNIEQDKKWDPAYQSEVIEVYARLSRQALAGRPDLLIWPETSTPFYFGGSADHGALTADLRAFVKQGGAPLLFGSPTYEIGPRRTIRLRNSAFLLDAQGATVSEYHKIHLVPFGEYVPLKRVLFFVEKMVEAVGDFQGGSDYTVMPLPSRPSRGDVRLSTVICYEIIFPDLVRRFVKEGANVMTTITNDAWFGRTAAPQQHFSMAVLRAVENRVPVVRAANTGISGYIDSRGRILQQSGIFVEAQLLRSVTPGSERTFYTRHGDLFAYVCCLLALLASASTYVLASRTSPQDRSTG